MFSRLTMTGKVLVAIVFAVLVGGAFYLWGPKGNGKVEGSTSTSTTTTETTKSSGNWLTNLFSGKSADLTIGLNTWSGFAPPVWYNDGKDVNKESKFYKEFGLKLQINQMDDRKVCIESLLADQVDAIYTTTDISSAEMGDEGQLAKAGVVQFFKVDDSRGADVIVATRNFNSVSDLKKTTKIACAFPTASSTLLINWLDAGGKTIKDVTIIYVESGAKAAELFKAGQVDLAVVWSPDDGDCIKAVQGSHVATSTKYATSIIMDGMVAKKSVIESKAKYFDKLVRGWLSANAAMQDAGNRDLAAAAFSKAFGFQLDLVKDGVSKVRFSTYGDNKAFFGLDPTYTGTTGSDLYTRMSRIYKATESDKGGFYAKNPIPWVKASYSGVIEGITDMTGGNNVVEADIKFAPSTAADLAKPSMATRMVSINFATNQFLLDNDAKTIIDREVGPMAKSWKGAKIRIEGNTDNTGVYKNNKSLSLARAKSVMDYLMKTYGFDKNKFEIVGNGPDKPANGSTDIKEANATESLKTANRRTDFGLIAE